MFPLISNITSLSEVAEWLILGRVEFYFILLFFLPFLFLVGSSVSLVRPLLSSTHVLGLNSRRLSSTRHESTE
jgi:hypothetical protein